mmetsp:Transcript_20059/g.63952  ORF Transcript_20059/g.63952 Transcript_20059/m.63952 type:complete len:538 (-) Transcript_20059:198-1811(-)
MLAAALDHEASAVVLLEEEVEEVAAAARGADAEESEGDEEQEGLTLTTALDGSHLRSSIGSHTSSLGASEARQSRDLRRSTALGAMGKPLGGLLQERQRQEEEEARAEAKRRRWRRRRVAAAREVSAGVAAYILWSAKVLRLAARGLALLAAGNVGSEAAAAAAADATHQPPRLGLGEAMAAGEGRARVGVREESVGSALAALGLVVSEALRRAGVRAEPEAAMAEAAAVAAAKPTDDNGAAASTAVTPSATAPTPAHAHAHAHAITVIVPDGPLGLALESDRHRRGLFVVGFKPVHGPLGSGKGPVEASGLVDVGWQLTAANGVDLRQCGFRDALAVVRNLRGRRDLAFERPSCPARKPRDGTEPGAPGSRMCGDGAESDALVVRQAAAVASASACAWAGTWVATQGSIDGAAAPVGAGGVQEPGAAGHRGHARSHSHTGSPGMVAARTGRSCATTATSATASSTTLSAASSARPPTVVPAQGVSASSLLGPRVAAGRSGAHPASLHAGAAVAVAAAAATIAVAAPTTAEPVHPPG